MAGYLGGRLQVNDKSHRPPGTYIFVRHAFYDITLHFSVCCPIALEGRSDRHKQVIRAKPRKPCKYSGDCWEQLCQAGCEKTRGGRGARRTGRREKDMSRTLASLSPVEGDNLSPVNLQGRSLDKSLETLYSCGHQTTLFRVLPHT